MPKGISLIGNYPGTMDLIGRVSVPFAFRRQYSEHSRTIQYVTVPRAMENFNFFTVYLMTPEKAPEYIRFLERNRDKIPEGSVLGHLDLEGRMHLGKAREHILQEQDRAILSIGSGNRFKIFSEDEGRRYLDKRYIMAQENIQAQNNRP